MGSVKEWAFGVLRGLIPDSWGWAFSLLSVLITIMTYTALMVKQVINFPFLTGDWTMLPRMFLWLFWFVILTQPKFMDKGMEKACELLAKGADRLWAWLWHHKITLVILCFVFQAVPIFAFFFKTSRSEKKYWLSRLVLTFGTANFMVSSTITGKAWWGWLVAGMALPACILWYFLRSEEYKENAKEVWANNTWGKAIWILLVEDFLSFSWKCPSCGKKNPKKSGKGEPFCKHCGARNPKADWACPTRNCNEVHSHLVKRCPKCGAINPHLEEGAAPAPDGTTPPPAPDGVTQPEGVAPPVITARLIDCPHCGAENTIEFPRCGECGECLIRKTTSQEKAVKIFLES